MDVELGEIQTQFAELIWKNEPIGSGKLVKLCEKEFSWKKPTTYTVLRKLYEKGEKFVEESFSGSLPAFIAAFTSQKRLSEAEAEEIRRMIDAYRRGSEE